MVNTLIESAVASVVQNLDFYIEQNKISLRYRLELHQRVISALITQRKIENKSLIFLLHENLSALRLSGASVFISDSALIKVSNVCTNIRELSLYGCSNISEDVVAACFQVFYLVSWNSDVMLLEFD